MGISYEWKLLLFCDCLLSVWFCTNLFVLCWGIYLFFTMSPTLSVYFSSPNDQLGHVFALIFVLLLLYLHNLVVGTSAIMNTDLVKGVERKYSKICNSGVTSAYHLTAGACLVYEGANRSMQRMIIFRKNNLRIFQCFNQRSSNCSKKDRQDGSEEDQL